MSLAFYFALAIMVLRTTLHYIGHDPEGTAFMLVHLLALVVVVFFAGQRQLRMDTASGFPALVREGFKAAAVYTILYAIFIWGYFHTIDTQAFPERIQRMVEMAEQEGRPGDEARRRLQVFFTPFNYATMTFFGLLAIGAFNALLLGVVHHKVLRRFRR
ncbi:MAG: DUF4199 family protein [Flavobacteriales bacterium]|nr:DUF4199 family protein [Flavobacteriales bacterium]MCB9166495.1 DUF4199 family protein [Flavobacteriales bacterium]